jgi:hypothetical protein
MPAASHHDDLIHAEQGSTSLHHRKDIPYHERASIASRGTSLDGDLRYGNRSTSSSVHDPLLLNDRKMDPEHIASLRTSKKGRL